MEPQCSRRRIQGDELVVTFAGVSSELFFRSGLYIDGGFQWRVGLHRRQGTVVIGVGCLNIASEEMVVIRLHLLDLRRSPPVAQKTLCGVAYPGRPYGVRLAVAALQAQGLLHRGSVSFCFSGYRLQQPQSSSSLGVDLGRLLQSGEGTDVIFNIGEEDFPAHRSVVLARSPALSARILDEESEVRINGDIDPKIFRGFLKYLYTDLLPRVEDITDSGAPKQERLVAVQRLFILADKFEMDKMKILLEEKMLSELDTSTAVAILTFAQEHHGRKLLEDCCRTIVSEGWLHDVAQSESFSHLKASDYPAMAVDSLLLEAGRALKRPRII